ncbi:hypothetical protein CPB86DRAFT_773424 [Serendipita vermifera]|nr:hypothetical protein CPB86DRAFT_773424 [Serendipita vermifera]
MYEIASGSDRWLVRQSQGDTRPDKWTLRDGVTVNMYISGLPCGDASTRAIAALQAVNDPKMAALKDERSSTTLTNSSTPESTLVVRGRAGYSSMSRVRTKPGRGDAPQTNAMSCSDKIALWSAVGIQGALLASLGLETIYLDSITIGGVLGVPEFEGLIDAIQEDCHRAFHRRLRPTPPNHDLAVHPPHIAFTSYPFPHCRDGAQNRAKSSNEALCWVGDETGKDILVNGVRRGISSKGRSMPRFRPHVAKASLFAQYVFTAQRIGLDQSLRYVGRIE